MPLARIPRYVKSLCKVLPAIRIDGLTLSTLSNGNVDAVNDSTVLGPITIADAGVSITSRLPNKPNVVSVLA